MIENKILLVSPPFSPEERYGFFASSGSNLPPLGLLYVAAVLSDDHDVRVLDGSAGFATREDILETVRTFRPRVVGITVMTPTLYRALEISLAIKELEPETTIVLGGPHPSALPEETAAADGVDYVVVGEGETTFKALVTALENGNDPSDVEGLCFRRGERIVRTPSRKRIRDLDSLPYPARHLVPLERYTPSITHYRKKPALSVVCGRGCPYRCSFCSCSKVFRDGVTIRSPKAVVAEIRFLAERYGAREILLWDDTFGLSRDWTMRFCTLMEPLGISWSAWMRCDLADPEKLEAMAQAGCWNITYGVESGDSSLLEGLRKGISLEQVRRSFAWTREAGIETRGTFILGLPGETEESIRRTTDLAISLKADYAQFHLLTPYPGAELWDSAGDHGKLATDDLSKYTIWSPVFVPDGMSAEDLETALREAYRRFYFRIPYLLGRFASIRSFEDIRRHVTGFSSLLHVWWNAGKAGR